MAFFKRKKESTKKQNDDDFDDFDDFDMDMDGFDDIDDMMNRKPSKREMAKMTAKSAIKNTGKHVAKDIVGQVIPGDFEYNITELKDLINETKDTLKFSLFDTAKTASKIMPKAMREKFGFYDEAKVKAPSKQDMRASEMHSELETIFGGKLPSTKQFSSKEITKDGQIRGKGSELAMASLQNRMSASLGNDMSKLTGFVTTVANAYFKKSLELQYNQYYLGLDMIELQSTYFKAFSQQFEGIVKNTALPEHVKITNAERIEGYLKQAMIEKTYARAVGNNEAISNFKTNFGNFVKNKAGAVKDAINMVIDLKDSTDDNKSLRYEIATDIIGGLIGERAAGKLGKLTGKVANKFKDNKTLKRIGIQTEDFVQNTEASVDSYLMRIKDKMEKLEDDMEFTGTLKRKFYGGLGGLLKMFKGKERKTKLQDEDIDFFKKGAMFDQLTHRTINEGIPMLLGSILRETTESNRMFLRANARNKNMEGYTPYKGNELLHYNIFDRKLTTMGDYQLSTDTMFGKTFNKNDEYEAVARNMTGETISKLKGRKELSTKETLFLNSTESKNALSDYIKTASADSSITADFDTMFKDVMDPSKGNEKLRALIANNHTLERTIKYINKAAIDKDKKNTGMDSYFNDKMDNANSNLPYEPVVKFFARILELGSQDPYNITPKEGKIIALAVLQYLMNEGKRTGLNLRASTWEKIFLGDGKKTGIRKDDLEVILVPVTRFFQALENINELANSDNLYLADAAVNTLSTAMNARLRIGPGADKVLDVTQDLKNLNPALVHGVKEIDANHIVMKTLTVTKEEDRISADELFKYSRPKGEILNAVQSSIFATSFGGLADGTDQLAKDLKAVTDMYGSGWTGRYKQMQLLMERGRDGIVKKYKDIRANSDEYINLAKQFSDKLATMSEKAINEAIVKMVANGDSLVKRVESWIEDERTAYQTEADRLNEMKNIKDRILEADEENTVIETLGRLKARHEKRVDALEKVLKSVKEINDSVKTRAEKLSEGQTVESRIKSIKETIAGGLDKLGALVEMTEAAKV